MLIKLLLIMQLYAAPFKGTLSDAATNEPIAQASILLIEKNLQVISDDSGNFIFKDVPPGSYTLKIEALGYEPLQTTVFYLETNTFALDIKLTPITRVSEEVVVTAIRANAQTPVTQYNLNEKQLQEKYFGHDIPALISTAPSMYSYSDAGNGIGYSYFRLRGIEQTRINMTINGIPINDPETQSYFFNNFADLATSLKSIQIQRGVGTTTNGTASFGGAVNMISKDLAEKPSFRFSSGYGSFVSRRLAAELQTGLLKNKFAFYGRISNVGTDGYRNNSSANINSYFVSGAYFGKKSLLKINSFGGKANSTLAYFATPKFILDTNRTYNPLGPANKDQFRQTFHQVQYTYEFSKKINLASSAYFVKGDGYFDLYFPSFPYFFLNMPDIDSANTATDVVASYRLNQYFYGAMAYLNYSSTRMKLNVGIHGNKFQADHFMRTKWAQNLPTGIGPEHEAYFNTGYKDELSAFVKLQYAISEKWSAFADAQVRHTTFRYKAVDKPIFRDTFNVDNMQWTFFNPKLGMRYNISTKTTFYLSAGKTTREPTRIDYLGDDRANFDVRQQDVKPETIYNLEAGNEIRTKKVQLLTNIYFMEFRNEIAATGALNFFGYAIRKNVPQSFRRGLELDWTWRLSKYIALTNTSVFSYNKIKTYTQSLPIFDSTGANTFTTQEVVLSNVTPVLTPSMIVNQGIRLSPASWCSLEVIGRYVSKMYLDNTNEESLTIPSYLAADARLALKLNPLIKSGDHTLSVQLNNLTNTNYFTSGTPTNFLVQDGAGNLSRQGYPSYFPAATRNIFVTLDMKF